MRCNHLCGNRRRRQFGAVNIGEFGAAFALLIAGIVLPLLNLSIVPFRFGLGKSIVGAEVRRLAQCETFSEALKRVDKDSTDLAALEAIGGIVVKDTQLTMTIESTRFKDHKKSFSTPKSVSLNWLPNGSESPCVYMLELKVSVDIYPFFAVPSQQLQIPGLTGPVPIQFHEMAAWENLGCDPITGEFYLNQ